MTSMLWEQNHCAVHMFREGRLRRARHRFDGSRANGSVRKSLDAMGLTASQVAPAGMTP